MSCDAKVLGVMVRLARRRESADEQAIALRTGGPRSAIRAALRRLAAGGWVERRPGAPPRLTMAGLALAVARLPPRPIRLVKVSARRSVAA
jgi:DNA-binding IclR family transcriptional regulator